MVLPPSLPVQRSVYLQQSNDKAGTNSMVSFANSQNRGGALIDMVTIVVKDTTNVAVAGLTSSAFNFILAGGGSSGVFGTVTQSATPGTYTVGFTGAVAVGTASTLTTTINGVSLSAKPHGYGRRQRARQPFRAPTRRRLHCRLAGGSFAITSTGNPVAAGG